MNKGRPPPGSPSPSWFTRLRKWLTRVPADNEQLLALLRSVQENNLFDADGLAMIEGVLEVDDMQVRDIMIPRTQVVMLERDASPDILLRTIIQSGHSRFPVFLDTIDNITGMLYAKDLLRHLAQESLEFDISTIIRKPYFVPESKRLNSMLTEFKRRKVHIAVAVDEYGGTSGIVCMEDIIEEIVGDIQDEFDNETEEILEIGDQVFLCDARINIADAAEHSGGKGFQAGDKTGPEVKRSVVEAHHHPGGTG